MKTPPRKQMDCPACGSPHHRNTLKMKDATPNGVMYECGCGYGLIIRRGKVNKNPSLSN